MMLFNPQRVLVVAAHPDDEMLGCGGFLARLAKSGARIGILLLGEGPAARKAPRAASVAVRGEARRSAYAAASVLGITELRFANLPDNRFDTVPFLDVVQTIETCAADSRPDLVLTHFSGDLNQDHRITQTAVMTAFRPLPGEKSVSVLSFEVLSSTEYASPERGPHFQPTVFVDIAETLELKQRALAAYAAEMRPWPHPRSHEAVEHLARLRGSQCGKDAAEAFVLCRTVA